MCLRICKSEPNSKSKCELEEPCVQKMKATLGIWFWNLRMGQDEDGESICSLSLENTHLTAQSLSNVHRSGILTHVSESARLSLALSFAFSLGLVIVLIPLPLPLALLGVHVPAGLALALPLPLAGWQARGSGGTGGPTALHFGGVFLLPFVRKLPTHYEGADQLSTKGGKQTPPRAPPLAVHLVGLWNTHGKSNRSFGSYES